MNNNDKSINTNQLVTYDNENEILNCNRMSTVYIPPKETLTFSSFKVICNNLYDDMKNDDIINLRWWFIIRIKGSR